MNTLKEKSLHNMSLGQRERRFLNQDQVENIQATGKGISCRRCAF